jgi:hypothetical protein
VIQIFHENSMFSFVNLFQKIIFKFVAFYFKSIFYQADIECNLLKIVNSSSFYAMVAQETNELAARADEVEFRRPVRRQPTMSSSHRLYLPAPVLICEVYRALSPRSCPGMKCCALSLSLAPSLPPLSLSSLPLLGFRAS